MISWASRPRAAAAGFGAMVPVTGAVAASDNPSTDFTRWLDSIPGTHKQLYDMPELNRGMGLIWSFAFFVTGAPAYGVPRAIWASLSCYGITRFLLPSTTPSGRSTSWGRCTRSMTRTPKPHRCATRSTSVPSALAVPLPDAVLQKLIARGVKVSACDLAITVYSGMVAQKMGLKNEDVKKDWTDAVLPGIQIVPSGVVACNGAVSRGCVLRLRGLIEQPFPLHTHGGLPTRRRR